VNLYDFWVDFEGDIDNSNELASSEYVERLKDFCEQKRSEVSRDRGLTWMVKREVDESTIIDQISDENWRKLCLEINILVKNSGFFVKMFIISEISLIEPLNLSML
jgi:hypothetical protein